MKRKVCVLFAVLGLVAYANATPAYSNGFEDPFIPANQDLEGQDGQPWAGNGMVVLTGGSMVPEGFKFAQQSWNGWNLYDIAQDTSMASEGVASMRVSSTGGEYNDVFVGVMVDGLTPGGDVTVSFDLRADPTLLQYAGSPGQGTGDDHVNSVSYNFMAVADSPDGWLATEDYPGHETGSTWINDSGDWDGNWHTQSTMYSVTAPSMALVIKIRMMGGMTQPINLDNFLVPEPASFALLALGGLAFLRRRR